MPTRASNLETDAGNEGPDQRESAVRATNGPEATQLHQRTKIALGSGPRSSNQGFVAHRIGRGCSPLR